MPSIPHRGAPRASWPLRTTKSQDHQTHSQASPPETLARPRPALLSSAGHGDKTIAAKPYLPPIENPREALAALGHYGIKVAIPFAGWVRRI